MKTGAFVIALAGVCCGAAQAWPVDYRVVAVTGDPVPGLEGATLEVTPWYLGGRRTIRQSIDAVGRALLIDEIDGMEGVASAMVAEDDAGGLRLITYFEEALEEGVKSWLYFGGAKLGDGSIVIPTLEPGGSIFGSVYGMWMQNPSGEVAPIVQPGDVLDGVTVRSARPGAMTTVVGGEPVFSVEYPDQFSRAFVSGMPGDLRVVAAVGNPAPGMGGWTYSGFRDFWVAYPSGFAFQAYAESDAGGSTAGVWEARDGELSPVLIVGETALPEGCPELADVFYNDLRANSRGDLLMPVVGSAIDRELLLAHDEHGLRMVAVPGEQAPGFPTGVVHWDVSPHGIDGAGNAVYSSLVVGEEGFSSSALYVERAEGPAMILREGGTLPGMEAGNAAGWLSSGTVWAHTNHWGQVVFSAFMEEPASPYGTARIWASVYGDRVLRIIGPGDEVMVRGELKVVAGASLQIPHQHQDRNANPADGRTQLNDRGELITLVRFEDDTNAWVVLRIPFAADANGDRRVGFEDLNAVLVAFGAANEDLTDLHPADVTFDGVVGFADVMLVLDRYGMVYGE